MNIAMSPSSLRRKVFDSGTVRLAIYSPPSLVAKTVSSNTATPWN